MAGSKLRKLNMDALDEELKFPSYSGGVAGGMWFSWPDYGNWHQVRFIGPWDDADMPWTPHCVHYRQIGSERSGWDALDGTGKRRAITCSEYHLGETCPVCELIAYCEKRGQDMKGMRPKVQWLTNVAVDGEMKVWGSTPVSVIKKLKSLARNARFGPKIFDPEQGRDMDIIRNGDPKVLSSIEYDLTPCDPSPLAVPDWEKGMHTLSSFIKHYDRDLVIKVLESQVGDFLPVRECFRAKKTVVSKKKSKVKTAKATGRMTRAAKKPASRKTKKKVAKRKR